uniref:RAP domain-containing protein n=1 Tax=Babesia bovis TaxID=5865 RepID=A7ATR6_BABBO|eukprot:XP_001609895.1 hypothetical protein [Babesia bovis T2Bo]
MLQAFVERDVTRNMQPDKEDIFAGYHQIFKTTQTDSKECRANTNLIGTTKSAIQNTDQHSISKVVSATDITADEQSISSPETSGLAKEISTNVPQSGNTALVLSNEIGLTPTQLDIVQRAKDEVLVHFENPANKHYLECRQHSMPVAEAIVRDERYDLLLHDLYENRTKLDPESACHVVIALDVLKHKHYRLLSGILRHLLKIPLYEDIPTGNHYGKLLLKACQCFIRAGFYDSPLYSKVYTEIYRKRIEYNINLDKEAILESLRLFSNVDTYDPLVFKEAARVITRMHLNSTEIADIASAYAAHRNYTKVHDDVMVWTSRQLAERIEEFDTPDIARCVHVFSKMKLYFKPAYDAIANRITEELETATRRFAKTTLTIPQIAMITQHVSNFAPKTPTTLNLIQKVLLYLEEYIDHIDEKTAINLALSICANMAHGMLEIVFITIAEVNTYISPFLLRKIGSGTDWEQCKYTIFVMWLYHLKNAPEAASSIHKRCIYEGMREWLLRHGNGTQFRQELDEVADILQTELGVCYNHWRNNLQIMNISHMKHTDNIDLDALDTVYKDSVDAISSIDVLIDNTLHRVVINETACRNYIDRPIGPDLLILNMLESHGVHVHSINFQHWRSMERKDKISFLRNKFGDPDTQ